MIRPQTCPVCDKELASVPKASSNVFPFCSDRCRQVDMFRWCKGKYAIVEPLDPESIDPDMDTLEE